MWKQTTFRLIVRRPERTTIAEADFVGKQEGREVLRQEPERPISFADLFLQSKFKRLNARLSDVQNMRPTNRQLSFLLVTAPRLRLEDEQTSGFQLEEDFPEESLHAGIGKVQVDPLCYAESQNDVKFFRHVGKWIIVIWHIITLNL